jgi:hypothetical protein
VDGFLGDVPAMNVTKSRGLGFCIARMEIDMIRTESVPSLLDGPVSQFVAKIRHSVVACPATTFGITHWKSRSE